MSNAADLAEPPVATTPVRLLRGVAGWWAVTPAKVAHLPVEAVSYDGGDAVLGADARRALDQRGFFDQRGPSPYAVTVLTATACNLGCAYCFQNTALPAPGSSAPPRIEHAVLTDRLVSHVSTFVARQMRSTGREASSLLIFGGEPLLNVRGSLKLLTALQPHNLTMSEIVTNGVLMTPRVARQLADAGLRRVQITFDGGRDAHDTIRVTRNGRATYDKILTNIAAATAATDLTWNFRVNVSQRNVDGLDDLVDDLAEVTNGRRASFHLALIDDVGLGYDNTVGYDVAHARAFVDLNRRAIAAGMSVPLSKPLHDCPYCSEVGGTAGAVINADGVLYSCWETAGRREWSVGDVEHGFVASDRIASRWVACDYDIEPHGSAEEARAFFDVIDAAALDAMHGKQRPSVVGAASRPSDPRDDPEPESRRPLCPSSRS